MSSFLFKGVQYNNLYIQNFIKSNMLLNKYFIKDKNTIFGEDYIGFTSALADSLNSFFELTIELYKKLKIDYENSRFYSFSIDTILSSPSSKIFTETPRVSEFDPIATNSIKIANLANKMFLYIENNTNILESKEFNRLFQDFYIISYAYYDFSYSFEEQKGVFNKFQYDKKLFFYIKNKIEKFQTTRTDYKQISNILPRYILSMNIEYLYDRKLDYKYKNVYDEYVKICINTKKDKKTFPMLEIFTSMLGKKVWKIERMYQRTPEYINNYNHSNKFNEKVKEYIDNSLSSINDFYTKKITYGELLEKINKHDRNIIKDYVLKELFENINETLIQNRSLTNKTANTIYHTNKFFQSYYKPSNIVQSFYKSSDFFKPYYDSPTSIQEILLNTVKSMIEENKDIKEKFKLYRFIENAKNTKTLNVFLQTLYNEIFENKRIKNKEIFLIGILRSGSFLSHALSIMLKKDNKKTEYTYFFITHPYLSILPRRLNSNNKNISYVFIDEAIKSGYSLNLANKYIKRTLMLKNHDYNLTSDNVFSYSVADFKQYNRENNNIKTYNLADINIIHNKEKEPIFTVKIDIDKCNINRIFQWDKYIENISKDFELEELKKGILKRAKISINNEKRLDLVNSITKSEVLFRTCIFFVNDIYLHIKENQQLTNIIFYPGSPEGKLITDTIGFILKIHLQNVNIKQKIDIILNGKNKNKLPNDNFLLVFTDLSIISGNTEKNIFNLDVSKKIKDTYKRNDFDKKYIIYSEDNPNDKIVSIICKSDIK